MPIKLIIISFTLLIVLAVVVLLMLKKDQISIKYSILWFFIIGLLLLFTVIPGFLSFITKIVGIKTGSNLIFAFLFAMTIFMLLSLTVIVSKQGKRIRKLIQEISILKSNK